MAVACKSGQTNIPGVEEKRKARGKGVAEALARSWQLSRPGSLTHREH